MKKRLPGDIILLLIITSAIIAFSVYTQNKAAAEIEMYYFYSPDCPNCNAVKPLLESLKNELAKKKAKVIELNVKEYNYWNPIHKFLADKITRKINTDFIPLPTTTVRYKGRFYTFIGRDEIANHLSDFFLFHAGIKKITARLNEQKFNPEECISCHAAKKLPPPSTFNCTYCCHRSKGSK